MSMGLLCSIQTMAQEALPYYCDFNGATEELVWEQYRLGLTTDEFYTWDFYANELQHYYPVGGTEVTDDWMVSPEFDFSNGATIDSISHAFGGFGFPEGADTIMIYVITGSSDPSLAFDVTPLALLSDEDYNPDNIWRKRLDINIPAISGESHIAFRYKTTNNWLDVRIDDLYISDAPLGTSDNNRPELELKLFPNPASDFINIGNSEYRINEISIFEVSGKLVKQISLNNMESRISIADLPNGIYTVLGNSKDNIKALQKLVITR